MDYTAIGIVLGLAIAVVYAIQGWRGYPFDFGTMFVLILTGFAIPSGAQLMAAAFSGSTTALPSDWRGYVAAAGAIGLGLSLKFVWGTLRGGATKIVTPTTAQDGIDQPGPNNPRNS